MQNRSTPKWAAGTTPATPHTTGWLCRTGAIFLRSPSGIDCHDALRVGAAWFAVGGDSANLLSLERMVADFQVMAEKQLRGEPLTPEEYEKIRYYGGDLEHLTMAAADFGCRRPLRTQIHG